MEYLSRMERLIELMTSLEEFDTPEIMATLSELCGLLRISKGVTKFYASPMYEKRDEGEAFICYDTGEKHVLVSSLRVVTPAQMVIICEVYQAEGAAPLSEQERQRVQTIQHMILTFINKSRQESIIRQLMYWDDEGYHNLRFFYAEINRLKEAGQIQGRTAMRINLKHYSLVNEQVGKEKGDEVMWRYCQRLTDAMGEGGALCRLGGDNFVGIFDTGNTPAVVECLKGIPISYDDSGTHRLEVSAVAGLYQIVDAADIPVPGAVMEHIIPAYLIAKQETTEDVVFYSDRFKQEKARTLKIQRRFERALRDEEFQVYYQPKVDIQTRAIIGAEALCRWMHKGRLIPPMDFIPALERGTDICRLDFYMLDHVCAHIRRWLDEGRPVVRISVNLSRRHMIDPDLFQHIVEIIDRNRVPHSLIEIELTETTTDVEFRDLKRVVGQLQNAGISASVDDFGIGYSSLNLIKQIPWDVLKLDKSILPTRGEDVERGSRMFAHIIAMAHEIGLKCVAEGVETEEQLDIMRHYGCRIAQGFLFDRPLPIREFEKRMKTGTYADGAQKTE